MRGLYEKDQSGETAGLSKKVIMAWSGSRFEVFNSYPVKDRLKKWGFRWDSGGKVWYTKNPRVAYRARKWANLETDQLLAHTLDRSGKHLKQVIDSKG